LLLAASGFAIPGVMQANGVVLAALSLGMLGYFGAFGAFYSLPSSLLRGTAAAGGIGLFTTLGSFGGFFGPSLFGVLKEGTGGYATSMAAAAIGMMLAALIVLAVGRATAPGLLVIKPAM
jgi:MFS-type transporter involved in bile tolerance (Atg22 family)